MNRSTFVLSLILAFFVGATSTMYYKNWHSSQLGDIYYPTSDTSVENFDEAIIFLYKEGYCKGFPVKVGIYSDKRMDSAYNYINCGLRYSMVLTPDSEYMYLVDDRDAIPIGIVRYE